MEHYLDNSATTRVLPEAAEKAAFLMTEGYGNPSSLHTMGFAARQAVEEARSLVAARLGAEAQEIVFTSGGTESNNLALFGAALARKRLGNKIVTTAAEHDSVLGPCRELAKWGFQVVELKPDRQGRLPEEALLEAIDGQTILVSVMLVNSGPGGAGEPLPADLDHAGPGPGHQAFPHRLQVSGDRPVRGLGLHPGAAGDGAGLRQPGP